MHIENQDRGNPIFWEKIPAVDDRTRQAAFRSQAWRLNMDLHLQAISLGANFLMLCRNIKNEGPVNYLKQRQGVAACVVGGVALASVAGVLIYGSSVDHPPTLDTTLPDPRPGHVAERQKTGDIRKILKSQAVCGVELKAERDLARWYEARPDSYRPHLPSEDLAALTVFAARRNNSNLSCAFLGNQARPAAANAITVFDLSDGGCTALRRMEQTVLASPIGSFVYEEASEQRRIQQDMMQRKGLNPAAC
jgi:hypothetical protein